MKTRILFMAIILMVLTVTISAGPVAAKSEKTEFTGEWCRTEVNSGTTTFPGESGRVMRKDGWAYFDVLTDDDRVTGEFYSYDVTFNLSAPIPVDGPVPGNKRVGLVHANFILTPDPDSGISGTWEGWWKARYTIEDNWYYMTVTANGHGTGDLDGMLLKVYAKEERYDINCLGNINNGWPQPPFNGYILAPASAE